MSPSARTLGLVLLLASAAAPVMAARAVSFDSDRIATLVRDLNIESLQGRPSFGPGQDRTTDALVFTMRAHGLTPAGDPIDGRDNDGEPRRAWTQAVPMVRYSPVGTSRASLILGGQEASLAAGSQILLRSLRPVSAVRLQDAPLVFAGYGIDDPSRGWNDFRGLDLNGKVVLVLAGDPDTPAFAGPAMTYGGRWTSKIEAAARHGAAGILIIHDPIAAGAGWATLRAAFEAPQFDLLGADGQHPQIEGWVSATAAASILSRAGQDLAALRARAGQPGFQAVALTGAAFSAQHGVSVSQTTTYNVVGRIKGQSRPDQAVVVMSHWDGPGAVESQSAAALLELARAHGAQTPNARSMVFVLTGGAQQGGLGAAFYAAHPTYPLARTSAVIGLGPFDAAGPARDLMVYGDTSTDLSSRLAGLLTTRGRTLSADPDSSAGHAYRTDAFPLAKAGTPMITVGSGLNLTQGGIAAGQAWRATYLSQRYGKPADAPGRDLVFDGLAADLDPLYVFTRDLANQNDWPGTSAEFSSARAASAADRR